MDVPVKRARTETRACIICSKTSPISELTKPRDKESLGTLINAAQIHDFRPLIDLQQDEYDEKMYYHRNCRFGFTLKKTLDSLTTKTKNTTSSTESVTRKSSREAGSSSSRIYDEKCIFCDKKSKYIKGTKSREPLSQARELRSDETVRRAATSKLDERILAVTSRELVAAEAQYHKSCYHEYTREDQSKSTVISSSKTEQQYYIAEKEAYRLLFEHIRNTLFPAPKVVRMTGLTNVLLEFMNTFGYSNTEIKVQTKKHMKRKLESEFGESLHMFSDDNGRLLVIPDNLSIETLVKDNIRLMEQLESVDHKDNAELLIRNSGCQIRADIKNMEKKTWPPQPDQLNDNYVVLPVSLTCFLKVLLMGDTSKHEVLPTARVQRLIQSLGQDCVYAVSGGSIKPAKHILLPWGVKSLTGNVELIKFLNRLGHSISYSKLEEMDTALCLQKQEKEAAHGVILPSDTYPCIPTTLAFDNIDRLEETLSGGGTSHRVNGIIVQPQVSTVQLPKMAPGVPPKKKRSIAPVPRELPSYNAGQRVGPPVTTPQIVDYGKIADIAKLNNLVWSFVRQSNTSEQTISSWTGFNILTRDNVTVTKDTVGYLPTINAPATDLSTVYEVLRQVLKILTALNLNEIVCVFDQALYAKAAEITWKHEEMFQKIVLRMGVFHTICNLLSIIGKRFSGAGLRDISVESGVIAEGSITSVLEGRRYNRGVRLYKLVYEALLRLAWKGFYPWLEEHHKEDLLHLTDTIKAVGVLHDNVCGESLDMILHNTSCSVILTRFIEYLSYLRNSSGQLAAFWMSFVDMVDILLGLIRASREGNWLLHLSTIRSMIPWCFAYDKQNYARYLSIYYNQMTRLDETHPETHAHFQHGGFSVQLGGHNPFGKIPIDQTIEETVNKDTQTAGGTKGFSLQPGAVSRYYITAEYRSTCLKQLRSMTEIGTHNRSHVDLTGSRIRKDEKAVMSLVELMETNWTNPLCSSPSELISISTGTTAPPEVANDLLTAQQKGNMAYTDFQENRLEKRTQDFFDRLPRLQLQTFNNINKQVRRKLSNKEVILKTDHKLFGHMILVASSRKLNMKDVLQHPLGPLPWSLANCDGTMKKTNKASLARKIENNVSPAEEIRQPTACIIDGMNLVHKLNGENLTFKELSDQLFAMVLRASSESYRIDVIFDVYKEISIKYAERQIRGSDKGIRFTNIVPGHRIQQWRRLLSCGASKMKLIQFITDAWKEPQKRQQLGDKMMYVTCGEKCSKLTCNEVADATELRTTQEEADGRIILHAKHASPGVPSVIIIAEDTDVILLCLAFQSNIDCNMFVKCGSKTRIRYIDISKVAKAIGQGVCDALLGIHAFTGCDTVSAFGGRGKLGALKILLRNSTFQKAFARLGDDWSLSADLFTTLEHFTCCLYASRSEISEVNEMRYKLFSAKKGNIESGQLPPCRDCLRLHASRANYQAAIWQRALETDTNIPSPIDCDGWVFDENGQLQVNWMTGSPAPDVVLEFMSCKCKRKCQLPDCQCITNGLKCTDACSLTACENMGNEEDLMYDKEHTDSETSDEDKSSDDEY